jgi:hypothetical protein
VKLLLNHEIAADTEPYLPPDVQVVYVTDGGIIEGDSSDAEVFFRWWSPGYSIDKVITHTRHCIGCIR